MKTKPVLAIVLIALCLISSNIFSQLPCNVLVGYWQSSWGTTVRLKDINSNYNVINLAFLEADTDGSSDNNVVSALDFTPTSKTNLLADIPVLQAQGKKVLMSIGGASGSFKLSSASDVTTFVSKVETMIQTYGLDGIDIDLERPTYLTQTTGTISNPESHITNVISALQQLLTWYKSTYDKKMILTLVPEVAYTVGGLSSYMSSTYGVAYLPIIETLKSDIDLVMVQLYNCSGGSYGLDGKVYTEATADFIVSQTEAMIKGFTCVNSKGTYSGIDASKVAVCLPASSAAASSGFTSTANVKSALAYLRGTGSKPGSYTLKTTGGYPGLAGMATWSVNTDLDASYSYAINYASIFTSCLTTETEKIENNISVTISPNPAHGQITLNSSVAKGDVITIYNIAGIQVLQQKIVDQKTLIDVSFLPEGLYLLQTSGAIQKFVLE